MSETANPVVPPAVANNSSDLKPEQVKPATNDVANEVTAEVNNDSAAIKESATPATGRQPRRKRASEIADSSLVIATPPGGDGSRRQTRSQTRGTPAPPAPTPAKKPALEKASKESNGSAAKGRRGRPKTGGPKAAGDEKSDESSALEEVKEETKIEPKPETKTEAKAKPSEEKPEETVDGVSSTTGDKAVTEVKPEKKKEEAKPAPAAKVEVENSQEPEPPKEKVIEKPITESTDKGDNKVVNNATADSVNNHEQQA